MAHAQQWPWRPKSPPLWNGMHFFSLFWHLSLEISKWLAAAAMLFRFPREIYQRPRSSILLNWRLLNSQGSRFASSAVFDCEKNNVKSLSVCNFPEESYEFVGQLWIVSRHGWLYLSVKRQLLHPLPLITEWALLLEAWPTSWTIQRCQLLKKANNFKFYFCLDLNLERLLSCFVITSPRPLARLVLH